MRCASCGTELIPGKKFCHDCGTRVEIACPSCGSPVQAAFRFCPECGAALGAVEPPRPGAEQPPAPSEERLGRLAKHIPHDLAQKIRGIQGTIAGERKLVTVLFCDLVGSTAIAERLDPEEYRDLLDQYLELAFHEIYRFEGIVNQLAGDGMMSLFGAPVAHEDAPYRAVRAACEIQQSLGRFNQSLRDRRGFELRARIGIHTGPVVVGTVGNDLKMDYTAIGDTTNLASRLQSLAAPGTILASEATIRLVRGFFQLRPVGPFEIRGKSEPVPAYEVLGRSEITTSLGAAEARGLTPLVGRHQELSQLADSFARVRGNLPQIVTVVGDYGTGKSRLIYEFKQSLAGQSVVFLEGRCAALRQKVPYSPFIFMMRQYFSITQSETSSSSAEKIAAKVKEWDPTLEQIYPFLCRLLSVGGAPPKDVPADETKRDTYHALAKLVGRISESAPVVMLIEDLHWIDESSRELLELAVSELTRARVMMVFTHRPDYQASWRAQVAFTQLTLRSLSDDETRDVIRAVAGGPLPEDLEQRILAKAEGSPFFAEEITRALFEEGYLSVDNGNRRLTRPLEEVLIPGTVREVIAARLDRLGGSAKRLVQVASVLGRQFHSDQLARLLQGDGIDIAGVLATLEQRGILHRKNVLSADEYRFGESLTQEVAYDGLLMKERRQIHERIAWLLDATASDGDPERAALLAHHFARSDNRAKAVETLMAAARQAERLPSYTTASDLDRQAWEIADATLTERPDADEAFRRLAMTAALHLCRMAVIYVAPGSADLERAARRGRELAEALGDTASLAGFYTYHGMITMSGGRDQFAEGLSMVEKGLSIAQQAGLGESAVSISRGLAFAYFFDGQLDRARAVIDQVAAALDEAGHAERLSDLYFGARWMQNAMLMYASDDLTAAIDDALDCHQRAIRANNRTSRSGMAAILAQLHFMRGDYEEAKRWADQSLKITEVIGNVTTNRMAAIMALGARLALGESVTKSRYLKPVESSLSMAGNQSLYVLVLVDVLLDAGEVELAERAARIAIDHAGGRLRHMLASLALGNVLLELGADHWDAAGECFELAARLAGEIGVRAYGGHALLGLGRLAAARNDRAYADRCLREAESVFRELGLGRYAERSSRRLVDSDVLLPQSA